MNNTKTREREKKEQVKRLREFEKAKKELERQRHLSNSLSPIPKNSILRHD